MNLLNNLREQLSDRERLSSLLPIGVIVVIVLGYVLFIAISIVPQVRALQDLSAQLDTAEQALVDSQKTEQESPEELRQKIEAAQAKLNEAAGEFLSESQAAEVLNRLYQYAGQSGVTIVDLQSQPGPKVDEEGLYDVRTFAVQVDGTMPGLVSFMVRIREAALKSFVLANVNITEGEDLYTLTMDVVLYTSPYSGGSSSDGTLPTPDVMSTPTLDIVSTPTLDIVSTPTLDIVSTPTPASQATFTPFPTATAVQVPSPTPTPQTATIYVVRQGDTLYSIARRYGTTVEDIIAVNELQSSNIYVGQQLRIPAR